MKIVSGLFTYLFLCFIHKVSAQEMQVKQPTDTLSFEKYIRLVIQHHPAISRTNLNLDNSRLKVRKARGEYDPKIKADYQNKDFKNQNYWETLYLDLSVPLYFGININGGYANNTGQYLDLEQNLPTDGLYHLGFSVSPIKGLLTNDRMSQLRQAKAYLNMSVEKQKLEQNKIISKASKQYIKWYFSKLQLNTINNFMTNAQKRFHDLKKSVEAGDKAAIDSTEAKILFQTRSINAIKNRTKVNKNFYLLNNYLWFNGEPIILQKSYVSDSLELQSIKQLFRLDSIQAINILSTHPKILALQAKNRQLRMQKRLEYNNLLPDLKINYNFISAQQRIYDDLKTSNFKSSIALTWPLFMRKARAGVGMSNNMIQQNILETDQVKQSITNKILAQNIKIQQLEEQYAIAFDMVNNYNRLFNAELRQFNFGGSSLFYVNIRENKFLESKIKLLEIEEKLFLSLIELYEIVGFSE